MREIQEYKKEFTTLGIACAGVYATAPNKYSSTTATSITIYDNRLTPYLGDLVEGGVVIDKRPCTDKDDFYKRVIGGAMLRESLPDGHMDSFSHGLMPYNPEKCGSLDYIALDVYLKIWRDMGARIGKRVGNTVVWEDGMVYKIPPAQERYQHEECG